MSEKLSRVVSVWKWDWSKSETELQTEIQHDYEITLSKIILNLSQFLILEITNLFVYAIPYPCPDRSDVFWPGSFRREWFEPARRLLSHSTSTSSTERRMVGARALTFQEDRASQLIFVRFMELRNRRLPHRGRKGLVEHAPLYCVASSI